jgi:hypothetical protein
MECVQRRRTPPLLRSTEIAEWMNRDLEIAACQAPDLSLSASPFIERSRDRRSNVTHSVCDQLNSYQQEREQQGSQRPPHERQIYSSIRYILQTLRTL